MIIDYLPGFFQGITRVLISYPFDYVKTYLQMNKCTSIRSCLALHGISGLYRGATIPLVTVPLDRALQYRLYEQFNKKMNPFSSAFVCGAISAVINLPVSSLSNNYILEEKNVSFLRYLRQLRKTKTVAFLFYGFKPELARSIVSTTIFLGVYGNMREIYGNSKTQCVINSVTASVALWTVAYPLDTLKVAQQTEGNPKIREILRSRVQSYGYLNLWRGILPVYARTIPSSATGMLVYEKTKELVEKIKN